MSFLVLPSELIALVFIELDGPSLLRCMQVCKQFYSIIRGSSALLYRAELFFAQMENVEHCNWELQHRLEAIRTFAEAWNKLKFPQYGEIHMERDQPWGLSGGILAQAKADGGISCIQLPSSVKGIPEHRWYAGTGFKVRHFTMDMSQDLLVAIELQAINPTSSFICNIHLRSCITGHVHSEATSPVITPTFLKANFAVRFLIRICGPYVAILFTDWSGMTMPPNFAIWNWRNGVLQMHAQGWEFRSFTFLSDELVLVAFVDELGGQLSLRIIRITSSGDPVLPMKDVPYLGDMRYPRFRAHGWLTSVLILSEPSPTGIVPANLTAPFVQSSADVLFTVAIRQLIGHDSSSTVMHFLHRSTILSQVQHVSSRFNKVLEWGSWGPAGSRMLKLDPSHIWVCYSYGTRFIWSLNHSHRPATIYDFNPYAFKKVVQPASRHPLPWNAMEKETKLPLEDHLFETEIVTFLPGYVAPLDLPPIGYSWEAAMITEDHIVLVKPELQMYAYMAM